MRTHPHARGLGAFVRALPMMVALFAVAPSQIGFACRSGNSSKPATSTPQVNTASPTLAASGASRTVVKTREECRACRGEWGSHGLAAVVGCNCRSVDAGRRCRDGTACQGQCVLDDAHPEVEVVSGAATPAAGAVGFFVGRCSEFVNVFGCLRVLPRGVAKTGPSSISELPPVICID